MPGSSQACAAVGRVSDSSLSAKRAVVAQQRPRGRREVLVTAALEFPDERRLQGKLLRSGPNTTLDAAWRGLKGRRIAFIDPAWAILKESRIGPGREHEACGHA